VPGTKKRSTHKHLLPGAGCSIRVLRNWIKHSAN